MVNRMYKILLVTSLAIPTTSFASYRSVFSEWFDTAVDAAADVGTGAKKRDLDFLKALDDKNASSLYTNYSAIKRAAGDISSVKPPPARYSELEIIGRRMVPRGNMGIEMQVGRLVATNKDKTGAIVLENLGTTEKITLLNTIKTPEQVKGSMFPPGVQRNNNSPVISDSDMDEIVKGYYREIDDILEANGVPKSLIDNYPPLSGAKKYRQRSLDEVLQDLVDSCKVPN